MDEDFSTEADINDKKVEYECLRDGLIWAEVEGVARTIHAGQTHVDGSPKLTHLYVVSELAGRYAQRYFADSDLFEQRYLCIVCRTAGLLHEALSYGQDFESLVDASDEAVARLVAGITPDNRLPRPKRHHQLANQVGLAPESAQLIVLADLQHTIAGLDKVLQRKTVDTQQTRVCILECEELLCSLGKIDKSVTVADSVASMYRTLKDMEKRCRQMR
jgi:(p)ppGpp synthase/HD superfamily hydrolase